MCHLPITGRHLLLVAFVTGLTNWEGESVAQSIPGENNEHEVRIVQIMGSVEIFKNGSSEGVITAATNQVLRPGDRLVVNTNSRASLLWSGGSVVPLNERTEIEVLPPEGEERNGLRLLNGILYFFHRDRPGRFRVLTRGGVAGVKGTEFVMAVDTTNGIERTTISLINGRVDFTNAYGTEVLTNMQQASAEIGKAPQIQPRGFIVNNILQWCFYYPAVLDLSDLELTSEGEGVLADSLSAYRAGNLPKALATYPTASREVSDAQRIYHAALLLSVGQVGQTEDLLDRLSDGTPSERLQRLATALRRLIAAVKREVNASNLEPQLPTEYLAASYYAQSRPDRQDSLRAALELGWHAATNSPTFGFAWARVAELEFSFGHTRRALADVNEALHLSPENAQALALKGFLLAAENRTREATNWFQLAINTDSALGNAWLGRGLSRIRLGDKIAGREDLLIAAALEPQRSLLRSYLGKVFASEGDAKSATNEFRLATTLDPKDPTSWLYSALLNEQNNRINEAVGDLEKSIELNGNRALFRSQMLLDEDLAVRSAGLARVYSEAGMDQASLNEAAKAVAYDYANYSAHLFVSETFNALRDPTRFNLRYETVWFNELLLANLLSPVGGTPLSQNISQQEYARFFERDHVGLSSSTLYRSDGQIWESASQYGTIGNTGWSLDLDYQHNDGVRPNNELDRIEWYTTIKQQLTPQDSVMLLTKYQSYQSGDNFQYYDPTNARPYYSFDEYQRPIILGAYHHEWQPGVHTLLMAGRLENEQRFSDRNADQYLFWENNLGVPYLVELRPLDVAVNSDLAIYTAEISQVFQAERVTVVAGGLCQSGQFNSSSTLSNPPPISASFYTVPAASGLFNENFERLEGYGYVTVAPVERLWLTGGLAYDWVKMPANFRNPPLSPGEETRSLLGPKAALVWSPVPQATVRGAYSRSLGGVSLDESYRLEPAQLAGFPQAFRSVISESLVGSVSAPEYETFGLALDIQLPSRTYASVTAEQIESTIQRTIGVFLVKDFNPPSVPSTTPERLDYKEQTVLVTVNRLLSDEFVFGLQYSFTQAELQDRLPDVPVSVQPSATVRSDLQRVGGYLLFNHPSGWFSRLDGNWYHQRNAGFAQPQPGDDFFQLDLSVGYRFARDRAVVTLGIMNLTDQDYRLNPLTVYTELPRERVFFSRLNFRF